MARKIYGRTLLELMSVLAILSILLTMALPNMRSLMEGNQRTQTVNQMISLLHHSRSQAVYTRGVVTLCPGSEQCSASRYWQGNLLLFLDRNGNGQLDHEDHLLHQAEIADELSWHWNRNNGYIQFEADGSTRALNGTLTLCRQGVPQHQIVIALAGRVRHQPPSRGAAC